MSTLRPKVGDSEEVEEEVEEEEYSRGELRDSMSLSMRACRPGDRVRKEGVLVE